MHFSFLNFRIPDGSQPVVLTLVDQDATLKELATRRATDYRPKSQETNVSDEHRNSEGLLRISKLLRDSNETETNETDEESKVFFEPELVKDTDPVVVRAERISHDDVTSAEVNTLEDNANVKENDELDVDSVS